MRHFLSYGGGVNSTALLLELHRRGIWNDSWEAVYCDTGAERQRTLDYVAMMRERFEITVIEGLRDGLGFYDYCMDHRVLPSPAWRWCTDHFKAKPLMLYIEERAAGAEYNEIIGYCSGEEHRLAGIVARGRRIWAPLIDWGVDRQGCVEIIEQAGFPVPPHSGCFICPFMRPAEIIEMRHDYPEEFAKAVALERASANKRAESGKQPYYILKGGSLESIGAQLRISETVATAQPAQLVMEQDAGG